MSKVSIPAAANSGATGVSLLGTGSSLPHPDEELTTFYRRKWARNATDEELHAEIDILRWRLETDDDKSGDALSPDLASAVLESARCEIEYRQSRGLSRSNVDTGWLREFLDDLKARIRIEDEIALALETYRSESNLKARCPFHPDNNPSLVVWFESQRWKCFGCLAGGDVISWVQAWLPTDFRGAVMYLSARAGITVPEKSGGSSRTKVIVRVA